MAAPAWWPTLTVEFQWGYGVGDDWTDTFTDETDRVRSVNIRNGRDDELQQTQTGTATIVLDNHDGALDPSVNTDVRPNVRVKVSAAVAAATPYSATTYYLFQGFIDAITPSWDSAWGETITVECVDPLALLALYPWSESRSSEAADDRWDAIDFEFLAAAQRPFYTISTAAATFQTLPAKTYDRTPMLDAVQEIADGEDGQFGIKCDPIGPTLFLHHKHYRTTWVSFSKTLTDSPSGTSEIEYESVELDYGLSYVYNDVTVTDDAAHNWAVLNSSSIAKFGDRKLDKTIPVDDTAEVIRRAEWIANMYGDPRLRVKSVVLRPGPLAASTAVPWHVALAAGMGNHQGYIVEGTRPGGSFTQYVYVEGVQHDIDASGEWTITLSTSPATISAAKYDDAAFVYDSARYA